MKSTPPASFTPDASAAQHRAQAHLLAILESSAVFGIAARLAFSTGDGGIATTTAQLLVVWAALVLAFTGTAF